MPTFPNSRRFASTTYALPGPTRKSTGSIGRRPERERRERLDAAEDVDLVGAGEVHRRDRGVRDAALERRSARGDALDAGDLRRDDAHVGGRDHRVATARNVRADARHGDVSVAEPDAGERLDLEVDHRRPLRLREHAHLLLAERDVVQHLRRDALEACRDLLGRQPEARAASQPSRRAEYRATASSPSACDGRDDLVHDLCDGVVVDPRVHASAHGVLQGLQGSLFRGCDYVCIDGRRWSCQIVAPPPRRRCGRHAPTMAVTSNDIARRLRISQSTVSRALRGDPRVAPETMARVLEAARADELHAEPGRPDA